MKNNSKKPREFYIESYGNGSHFPRFYLTKEEAEENKAPMNDLIKVREVFEEEESEKTLDESNHI